jgi:hypothetical protein
VKAGRERLARRGQIDKGEEREIERERERERERTFACHNTMHFFSQFYAYL